MHPGVPDRVDLSRGSAGRHLVPLLHRNRQHLRALADVNWCSARGAPGSLSSDARGADAHESVSPYTLAAAMESPKPAGATSIGAWAGFAGATRSKVVDLIIGNLFNLCVIVGAVVMFAAVGSPI